MSRFSSRSSRFYLVVSIAAAALAAITLFAYLHNLRSRIAESGSLIHLVVAARDLEAGEVLDSSCLSLVDFPDRYLLPGTCTDPLALTGASLRHALREGEPLLESALLQPGDGSVTCESLDKGFRAYPLPSSSVCFPAGELPPGSRIDILAAAGEGVDLLLENVEVISVFGIARYAPDGEIGAAAVDGSDACILLQLTCEEACRLAAAQSKGEVEILLRPRNGM
ncbi:MAG: Flp pilus assembly protein CpaB [Actinobacteria bacterium]|jgi:pilus assembly protein CpaB|nr:MAG: Flp pilus assembly protein CpaB [Actinomycetota bacterium]